MEMTIKAPAKVNWHLQVGKKRNDGFHEIVSIFQKISLCDELKISYSETKTYSCTVHGLEGLCEKGRSTIEKAANLWHESTGINASINVEIVKNIPSLAGLGGGSSDAASFLMALERFAGFPTSPVSLIKIAAAVGSDVPFFIAGCDAAIVTGRGEFVAPIDARHDLKGFLLFPKAYKVSTKEAYEALDKRQNFAGFIHENDLVSMYNKPVENWNFENDFVVVNKRPQIDVPEKTKLLLTGSGSCWVLVTDCNNLDFVNLSDCVCVGFDTN